MGGRDRLVVVIAFLAGWLTVPPAHGQVTPWTVTLYDSSNAPATPALTDLPLQSSLTQHGITWTFEQPARVGRFVNGDFYVVGNVTVTAIDPAPTTGPDRNGSMVDIVPNAQMSGFDDRESSGRYDSTMRAILPVTLTPGHKLVSSRSATSAIPCIMRPFDTAESPVASISILTSVDAPQPLDAFRPSYAQGVATSYLSRNLQRSVLPRLAAVGTVPPLSEFEGYLQRPWVDAVFYSPDVPAEYMAAYGRENGYVMSFAGLLLTLDFSAAEKEPLLIYLVQYGIDLYGLVQAGHDGWIAHGGHGSGRKFPILLAGVLLQDSGMQNVVADFGEDMHTVWVSEILPAGTYAQTWHRNPQTVAYSGHMGLHGEDINPGWGPYEQLHPAQWLDPIGEGYRRCCTSVCWVGQALAARLVPGMMQAWNHPQFFAYVDRWMMVADDPDDNTEMLEGNYTWDTDFRQGQSWRILSGGGYYTDWRQFVDEMWMAYRSYVNPDAGIVDAGLPDVAAPDRPASDQSIVDAGSRDLASSDQARPDTAGRDLVARDIVVVRDGSASGDNAQAVTPAGCACAVADAAAARGSLLLALIVVVMVGRRRASTVLSRD